MTPIAKDPKRRIRRIQRWLKFRKFGTYGELTIITIEPLDLYPALHFKTHKYVVNVRRLFRAELAWLCDYALRITTDHGRATSRLGEAEGALGRMRSSVHRFVPGLSPYSTHATMADALERAIVGLEALRAEKKRR